MKSIGAGRVLCSKTNQALLLMAFFLAPCALAQPNCLTPHTRIDSQTRNHTVCEDCGMGHTRTFKSCITTSLDKECYGGSNAWTITCSVFPGPCSQTILGDDRDCTPVPPAPPPPDDDDEGGAGCVGGEENVNNGGCGSPILVSLRGNHLQLTDPEDGVNFDLNSDGLAERMAWTAPGADDAFLVLDRNGNGSVDNGEELFGNFTPQPDSPTPNGFLALAVYDQTEAGGDGDGMISASDAVFEELQFWIDRNHDGVSQSSELRQVSSTRVLAFNLRYRESRRQDEYGNAFRYISTVALDRTSPGSRRKFAIDVFFRIQVPTS